MYYAKYSKGTISKKNEETKKVTEKMNLDDYKTEYLLDARER